MKSSLSAFEGGLNDLSLYVLGLNIESVMLSYVPSDLDLSPSEELLLRFREHIRQFPSQKRRFDYNSIIVSLYGYFEQYVESLVRAYVGHINEVTPNFRQLPTVISNNHRSVSVDLINRSEQQRHRKRILPEEIITNLHSCLSDGPYRLNADAFAYHSSNFRWGTIDDIFAKVGVASVSQRILKHQKFLENISRFHQRLSLDTIQPSDAFFYLDDLAERRNEVAHGSPSEVLSNEILIDYISFLTYYGNALYDVVRESALPIDIDHQGVELGKPFRVYNREIVCFTSVVAPLSVGDLLIARTEYAIRPYICGEILEIQIDGESVASVEANSSSDIGIRVHFHPKDNQVFFVTPKAFVGYS